MKSSITKKYTLWYRIFFILSLLCNLGPLGYYTVLAVRAADLTHEKVALSLTVLVVLLMTVISYFNKIASRSKIWIIFLALYIILDHILVPLVIFAACQVADELIISPIKHSLKNKVVINKQIDGRL